MDRPSTAAESVTSPSVDESYDDENVESEEESRGRKGRDGGVRPRLINGNGDVGVKVKVKEEQKEMES